MAKKNIDKIRRKKITGSIQSVAGLAALAFLPGLDRLTQGGLSKQKSQVKPTPENKPQPAVWG
jgi:hypothetical protein